MDMQRYLRKTPLLDFEHPDIQRLIAARGWRKLSEYDRIGAVYSFVKDEIVFGYQGDDALQSNRVLADGYGQCNTKGILLMSLLRALEIPCRLHGFTIYNALQKGAIPGWIIPFAPKRIVHSWVEVYFEQRWIKLEGFIIDRAFLDAVRRRFPNEKGAFSGYGIATTCLADPKVEWSGADTFIQKEGIADDFGLFDDPDSYFADHSQDLSGVRKWLYDTLVTKIINAHVEKVRNRRAPAKPVASVRAEERTGLTAGSENKLASVQTDVKAGGT